MSSEARDEKAEAEAETKAEAKDETTAGTRADATPEIKAESAAAALDETPEVTPETAFQAYGPKVIRGGPIAAALATAAMLAVTAVPAVGPEAGQLRVPTVTVVQDLAPVPGEGLAAFDLGADFGEFTLAEGCTVADRTDGSLLIEVVLVKEDPEAPEGFKGTLELMTSERPAQVLSEGLKVLHPPTELDDGPVVWEMEQEAPPGTKFYRAMTGRLEGTGSLHGIIISLRMAPGAAAWAGNFGDVERTLSAPLIGFVNESSAGASGADMLAGWLLMARR